MGYDTKVILHRTLQNQFLTLGRFILVKNGVAVFDCDSLELPWLSNSIRKSCIPAGRYRCERTWSPKLQRYEYEVMSVKGRRGIRFDVANYVSQLMGCIALGKLEVDSELEEKFWISNSRATNAECRANLESRNFDLIIYNPVL